MEASKIKMKPPKPTKNIVRLGSDAGVIDQTDFGKAILPRLRLIPMHVHDAITIKDFKPSNFCSSVIDHSKAPFVDTDLDQNFGKYFRAVTHVGKYVLYQVFLLIYLNLDSQSCHRPIYDFCLNKLNWTNQKLKNMWSNSELELIKLDPTSKTFDSDVTILFKVIINVLGFIPEKIIKIARDLKSLRNTLCHEQIEISGVGLINKINILKSKIKPMLEELQNFTYYNTSKFIFQYESWLDEIMMKHIDEKTIQEYLTEIKSISDSKQRKIYLDAKLELMNKLSNMKIMNPFYWVQDNKLEFLHVSKMFTPVKLVQDDKEIELNSLFGELKERFITRAIILSGQMGSGKSSVCKYIIHNWCTLNDEIKGLKDFDLVIYIEIKLITCNSLTQLLREQIIPETALKFSEKDLIPALQTMNILFVIDGADEATCSAMSIMNEIINKFTEARIVIATRPEILPEIIAFTPSQVTLELSGFDDSSVNIYVEKFFNNCTLNENDKKMKKQNFYKYISGPGNIFEGQLRIPLTIGVLLMLSLEDSLELTSRMTVTNVFWKLFNHFIKKNAWQMSKKSNNHLLVIEKKIEIWLNILGKISWSMLQKGETILSKESVKKLILAAEDQQLDPISTLSVYMTCQITESIHDDHYQYSFRHISFQELITAMYLSNEIIDGESVLHLLKDKVSKTHRKLLLFITGLIANKLDSDFEIKVANEIVEILHSQIGVTSRNAEFWWQLLKESKMDPGICLEVGKLFTNNTNWTLNSWDNETSLEAKLGILKQTYAAPKVLFVNIRFLTEITDHPLIMEILKYTRPSSKIHLSCDRQFNMHNYAPNLDHCVVPLLNKNNLIYLLGHLGNELADSMTDAKYIEHISFRISSLSVLCCLSKSLQKRGNNFRFSFKKDCLKFVELYLDINECFEINAISTLPSFQTFILKLNGITTEKINWVSEVIYKLNRKYEIIIFMSSNISMIDINYLFGNLKKHKFLKIRTIRVFSRQIADRADIDHMTKKYGIRIGWSTITDI